MIPLASLLNPAAKEVQSLPSPRETPAPSEIDSASSARRAKPPKMVKDAAIFVDGKVRQPIRYLPWETYDAGMIRELEAFSVYPLGRIATYHRHIPYNSDKKGFSDKTGRSAFEVFQYTFKMPNEEKEFNVMWDYNIGLVRITPFFKCCEYGKTVPARVLSMNPGLKEITHSITGGALAAQGYWMPFEAAKAVASTFCYRIRYALAPLFGKDFVDMCVQPGKEGHADMRISPRIVQDCTEQSREYRRLEAMANPRFTTPSQRCDSRPATAGSWPVNSVRPVPSPLAKVEARHPDPPAQTLFLPSPQSSLASKRAAPPVSFRAKALKRSSDSPRPRLRSPSPEDTESSEGASPPRRAKASSGSSGEHKASPGHGRHSGLSDSYSQMRTTMSNEDFQAAWTLIQVYLADSQPRRRASLA